MNENIIVAVQYVNAVDDAEKKHSEYVILSSAYPSCCAMRRGCIPDRSLGRIVMLVLIPVILSCLLFLLTVILVMQYWLCIVSCKFFSEGQS